MDWRGNRLLNKNGAFAPFLLECRVESLEHRCCPRICAGYHPRRTKCDTPVPKWCGGHSDISPFVCHCPDATYHMGLWSLCPRGVICGGDDCTDAWAGYVVTTGGLRRTIFGIECCPGAGTVGGQVAAHLGMGSNVYGAANVVAHAMPDNIGITGCYVQAQDIFYDPSGTWVYDSDCPYYPG